MPKKKSKPIFLFDKGMKRFVPMNRAARKQWGKFYDIPYVPPVLSSLVKLDDGTYMRENGQKYEVGSVRG